MVKRIIIDPGWSWDKKYTFSQGVRVDDLLFIAGLGPIDPAGNLVGKGDIKAQAKQVFENMGIILKCTGATFSDVAHLNIFVTDITKLPEIREIRTEYFKRDFPASTAVEAGNLALEEMMLEIDAVAILGGVGSQKKVIDPGWDWDDNFSFSQAVDVGDYIFVSGQVAIAPDGTLMGQGDVKAQTRQVFENLKTVLKSGGVGFEDVVKLTCYFTDISALSKTGDLWVQSFKRDYPTSTAVQVRHLALDGLMVEIEAMAVKNRARANKAVVDPGWPWDDKFLFSPAIKAGDLIFVSGQGAIDIQGRFVGQGDIKVQTRQALDNIETILKRAGSSLGDLVKINLFFTNIAHLPDFHEVRAEYLKRAFPASRGIGVSALAFKDMMVEIEAIARVGG